MTSAAASVADRQLTAYARFDARIRTHIKSLINDDLIAEHRRQPLGQHSDDLERVLNYFHRPPHYALYTPKVFQEYRIIRLPLTPGAPPQPIDDVVYRSKNEGLHAVFLQHLADLMAA